MNEHKKTSRSPSGGNCCSLFANGEHMGLRQNVFVLQCLLHFDAGEGEGLVATEDKELTVAEELGSLTPALP